jgi:hypothetical protein
MRRGVVGSYEGAKAAVLLVARLAAIEMGAHAVDERIRSVWTVFELDLDVAVEVLEALFARKLRAVGPEQPSQEVVVRGAVVAHRSPSA